MIASPCVSICTYDRKLGFCTGCGRTLDEIGDWGRAPDERRQRIIEVAAKRLGVARPPSL